jgi:hypothetical protein
MNEKSTRLACLYMVKYPNYLYFGVPGNGCDGEHKGLGLLNQSRKIKSENFLFSTASFLLANHNKCQRLHPVHRQLINQGILSH